MTSNPLLDILNSLYIVDSSCSCGEIEYILVANTKDNRSKLYELGVTEDVLSTECIIEDDLIDISSLQIIWTVADRFNPSKNMFCNTSEYSELRNELVTDDRTKFLFDLVRNTSIEFNVELSEDDFCRLFRLAVADKDISWILNRMNSSSLTDVLVSYITFLDRRD